MAIVKNLIASIAVVALLLTNVASAQQQRQHAHSTARSKPRTGVPSRWQGGPKKPPVQTASHHHTEIIEGGEYIVDSGGCSSCGGGCADGSCAMQSACSSCDGGGCDSCSVGSYCGSCSSPRGFCICFPSHGWVHAEYLLWYQSGMRVPPLVTSSPTSTARSAVGVLGEPTTSTLFGGGDDYLTDDRSGFRIRFGWWLSSFPCWGLEGEYTGLGEQTESYFNQSTGDPILARPFFNALDGREDSELVAFPDVVTGSIAADITSEFDGAAVRLRRQLCCSSGCCFSTLSCQSVPFSSRLDGTIGYRFWELDESLTVREDLQLAGTQQNGSFDIIDRFQTRNQFNGAELGVLWQGRRGWWSLDALMRLGIGNVHQTVTINGSTQIVENGATSNFDTGFLTQRTNIGTYDRDKFTMVPELGLTLGYQLTRRMRATMGYSLVYWGNVVRPGDQVDLDVNPNLLAPELDPFSGPLRPQFVFNETDYWVQGLSFGAEFRW